MKSIGIDIGSHSVKIAELEASTRGFSITSLAEHILSPDPNQDNEINILEILRNLASKNDPANCHYVFGLSQDFVSTRRKFFPFKERFKILKSLPFELEDDIPLVGEKAIFEAKIIQFLGSTSEVIACATKKEKVGKIIQAAHDAGIEPHIISMEAAALANNVENWSLPPPTVSPVNEELTDLPAQEATILLDIGHRKTVLCAFRGNQLVACRTIYWGGQDLAEAIAKKYGIMLVEAMRELQAKSFLLVNKEGATNDQIIFSDTIANSLEMMVHELKLSMMDLVSEDNLYFSNLRITGGVSRIKNLGAYLTKHLEIPCDYFDPFKNYGNLNFEKTANIQTGASVALGLAVEGIKRPKNPAVNFRRGEFGLQSQSLEIFWKRWSHAITLAAAAMLVLYIYSFVKVSFSQTIAEKSLEHLTTAAKNVLGRKRPKPREIQLYIKENQTKLRNQQKLAVLSSMNSALDVIQKASSVLPSAVIDVTNFVVDKESMRIEGKARSRSNIAQIQTALKSISINKKVEKLPSAAKGSSDFAFQIRVDRNIKGSGK